MNIAAALRRALAKWPGDAGEDAAPLHTQISGVTVADFMERGQRAQAAVNRILADDASRRAKAPKGTA